MADVKISALPAASTPLTGGEVLPIVQSSTTKQVAVSNLTAGLAGTATININGTVGATTPTTGAFTSGTFTSIVNTGSVSAAGTSTNSALPSFFANLSATATNVTGDGTAYTIICNTELFDRASNYNNATGVFTAPITGIYQFNATAFITDIQSTQNNFDIYLQATARNYHGSGNATALITFQNLILGFSGLIPLTSGDTVSMVVAVVGGTKTADVLGSSTPYTHFSGFLVA